MSRPTTRTPPRQVKRTWAFADFADRGVPRVQAIDECLVVAHRSFRCGAEFDRYRGIADMAGLAAGSTRSRMTHRGRDKAVGTYVISS